MLLFCLVLIYPALASLCSDLPRFNLSIPPRLWALPPDILTDIDAALRMLATPPTYNNSGDLSCLGREAVAELSPCAVNFIHDFMACLEIMAESLACPDYPSELLQLFEKYSKTTNNTLKQGIKKQFTTIQGAWGDYLTKIDEDMTIFLPLFRPTGCSSNLRSIVGRATFLPSKCKSIYNETGPQWDEQKRQCDWNLAYLNHTGSYFPKLLNLWERVQGYSAGQFLGRIHSFDTDTRHLLSKCNRLDLDDVIFDLEYEATKRWEEHMKQLAYAVLYYACEDGIISNRTS